MLVACYNQICFCTFVSPTWVWSVFCVVFVCITVCLIIFCPVPRSKKKTFFVSCLSPFPLWQWFDLLVLLSKTDPVWRNDWNLFPSLLPHLSSFFPSCVWPWFDFLFPAPRHSWQHDFVCSQMPRLPAGKSTLPSAIPLWLLACLWKQQEY